MPEQPEREKTCECGSDSKRSARFGHALLPWCAAYVAPSATAPVGASLREPVTRLIVEPTQDGRGIVGVWDVRSVAPERLAELRQRFPREFVYARDYDALYAELREALASSPTPPLVSLPSTDGGDTFPGVTPESPERTLRSLAAMLGWVNVPPRHIFEAEIRALKARAGFGKDRPHADAE